MCNKITIQAEHWEKELAYIKGENLLMKVCNKKLITQDKNVVTLVYMLQAKIQMDGLEAATF